MQHDWASVHNYSDLEPEAKAFVDWLIMPKSLRKPETQLQLANELDVGENTLSSWKRKKPFNDIRQERFRKVRAVEDLQDILEAAKGRAVKGEGKEANEATEIWLNWYYNQDFTKGTKVNQYQAQASDNAKKKTIDISEQLADDPEAREYVRKLRQKQQQAESD